MKPISKLAFVCVLLCTSVAFARVARDYRTDFYAHTDEIRACAGTQRGSVTLEVAISPEGTLETSRVTASSRPEMRSVGECVLGRARSWTFQRSSSGGRPTYELTIDAQAISLR